MKSRPNTMCILGDVTTDVYIDAQTVKFGGAALNMAMWVKRLGDVPIIVSAVGDDQRGQDTQRFLQSQNLSVSGVQLKHGATSAIDIYITNGERRYGVWNPGVLTDFHIGQNEKSLLRMSQAIIATVYPQYKHVFDELSDWRSKVKGDNQIPVVINFGDLKEFGGNLEIVKQYINVADIIVFGLHKVTDAHIIESIRKLTTVNQICIVTLGQDGSVAWKGKQKFEAEAYKTKVVDTTGAGDAFLAGFMTAYLRTMDIQSSLSKGAEVAAQAIAQIGAY